MLTAGILSLFLGLNVVYATIVFSEIQLRTADNEKQVFVELHNLGTETVELSNFRGKHTQIDSLAYILYYLPRFGGVFANFHSQNGTVTFVSHFVLFPLAVVYNKANNHVKLDSYNFEPNTFYLLCADTNADRNGGTFG